MWGKGRGSHDHLPPCSQPLQRRQDSVEQETIVELVFWLVDHERTIVGCFQQKGKQHADSLAAGEFVQPAEVATIHPQFQEVKIRATEGRQLAPPGSCHALSEGVPNSAAHPDSAQRVCFETRDERFGRGFPVRRQVSPPPRDTPLAQRFQEPFKCFVVAVVSTLHANPSPELLLDAVGHTSERVALLFYNTAPFLV